MNTALFAERLKAHGWTREPKAEKEFAKNIEVEAYKKRVNGVWIRIVIPQALFTTTAHVSSTTTPKTADVNDYSSKAMKLINLTWFPKPKARIKYWECPDCNANFPGPAEPVMVLPRHRFLNNVCQGSGRPGV